MVSSIKAVRGMNDILPDESYRWIHFEQTIHQWLAAYGYRNLRTPILEQTDLFVRSIGEVTDIVEKEMYTFIDHLNNDSLTLRPEGTASCVRAVIEHNLLYGSPQRLYYLGPMFRHAELIIMCARLWKLLGISGLRLEIGTLGNSETRATHRVDLLKYLEQHRDKLDEDSLRRLYTNPLRILDSKNPTLQEIINHAPKLIDYLDSESEAHFQQLQKTLREQDIAFTINLRLVRGLDYYNRTVFEWVSDQLGAQGTVCAGGRYDGLVEQVGGKPAPACGFAMGIERLLALMEQNDVVSPAAPDGYIVHQSEDRGAFAWKCAESLRDHGFDIVLHCGGGSFKAQMKKADNSKARYALIIGDDEVQAKKITVKSLRESTEQVRLNLTDVMQLIRR